MVSSASSPSSVREPAECGDWPEEVVRASSAPGPTAAVVSPAEDRASARAPGSAAYPASPEACAAWSQPEGHEHGEPGSVARVRAPAPSDSQASASQVPAVRGTRFAGEPEAARLSRSWEVLSSPWETEAQLRAVVARTTTGVRRRSWPKADPAIATTMPMTVRSTIA